MKIIDKAKGFYEDHKDKVNKTAATVGLIAGVSVAAVLGLKFGEDYMAFCYITHILTNVKENPAMLLSEYATKIGISELQ